MTTTIIAATAAAILAASIVAALAGTRHKTVTSAHPASPIDEAERILAKRYARGDISYEQYERMRIILRR